MPICNMGFNLKKLKNSTIIDEFHSIQLTGQGAVAELENKIASYYQMKHALCVSNATTGLLGLALALDLKNGEFITSPYTYGATISSWLMLNNSIIFGDIEPQTATLNPEKIKKIVTNKTKAILATDILGNPSDTKAKKGANPRHIRASLSNVLMLNNTSILTPDLILFAAQDFCATTDLNSAVYADLWAIEACSSKSFLPWTGDLENYPFPDYLRDIVDIKTGNINQQVLHGRLEEFRPNANL